MAHFGLVTLSRRHTHRQAGMGHTRQLGPSFYPGRSETDPLIPHAVQLPLDPLMVSTPAGLICNFTPRIYINIDVDKL